MANQNDKKRELLEDTARQLEQAQSLAEKLARAMEQFSDASKESTRLSNELASTSSKINRLQQQINAAVQTGNRRKERSLKGELRRLSAIEGQLHAELDIAKAISNQSKLYSEKFKQQKKLSDEYSSFLDSVIQSTVAGRALSKIMGGSLQNSLNKMTDNWAMGNGLVGKMLNKTGALGKSIGSAGSGFTAMLGPIGLVIAAIAALVERFLDAEGAISRTTQQLSIAYDTSKRLYNQFQGFEKQLDMVVEGLHVAKQELGYVPKLTEESLQYMGDLALKSMLTADTLGGVVKYAAAANVEFAGLANEIIRGSDGIISYRDVFSDIAKLSRNVRSFFLRNTRELQKQVKEARSLGLNLESAFDVSDQLLNIEDSLQKEFELKVITGNYEIDFNEARLRAAMGDFTGAVSDVASQIDLRTLDTFYEIKAVQNATGLTAEQIAIAQRALDETGKISQEAMKQIAEQGEQRLDIRSLTQIIQDNVSALLDKISYAVFSIAEYLVGDIRGGAARDRANEEIKNLNNQISELGAVQKPTEKQTEQLNKLLKRQQELRGAVSMYENKPGFWKKALGAFNPMVRSANEAQEKFASNMIQSVANKQNDFMVRGNKLIPFRQDDIIVGGTGLDTKQGNAELGKKLDTLIDLMQKIATRPVELKIGDRTIERIASEAAILQSYNVS